MAPPTTPTTGGPPSPELPGPRAPLVPSPWRLALAALSGVLYAAPYPPSSAWPIAFVSWVPLLIALRGVAMVQAIGLGLAQGIVANVVATHWFVPVIRTFGEAGPLTCLAVSMILWLYGGFAVVVPCALAAHARSKGGSLALGFVAGVALKEGFYPLLFPSFTGAQVHSLPLMMQLADIGGPVLVGVPLTMANAALAELIGARMERVTPSRWTVTLGLAAPILAALYGVVRMNQIDLAVSRAPRLEVGVVQPNTPHAKMGIWAAAKLYRTATLRFKEPPDLVVWPETALSEGIQRSRLREMLASLSLQPSAAEGGRKSALLTGAMLAEGATVSNSALLISRDGDPLGSYDKVHLLAFGEYVPFADVLPSLARLIPNAGRIARGAPDQPALMLDGHRLTALICYEDVIASYTAQAMAATRGELLVDLTNDSWFGDSRAAALHEGLAKFRAVEHRRFLVHAAASGISSFVDPVGRPLAETALHEVASITATVRWLDGETLFERAGDWPRMIALALCLWIALKKGASTQRESASR